MNQHQISDYIENLPLQAVFCRGYRPDEVYEAICHLSSMYNQILSEAYSENEELKRKVEYLEAATAMRQESFLDGDKTMALEFEKKNEKPEDDVREAMTDRELQRLKRGELLEILLEQSRENETLKMRLAESERVIEDLKEKLGSREIDIKNAGTIAEASFKLNGVFDAAEKAAQQYLENLQNLYEKEKNTLGKREQEVETKCTAMMQATQERCDFMKEDTMRRCEELETNMKSRCDEMLSTAERESKEMLSTAERESREMLSTAEQRSNEMLSTAQSKSDEILSSIDLRCKEREDAAEEKCRMLDLKAKADVDRRWDELSKRLEDFYNSHEGLKELMTASKMI